jgi:hypothetical protein
MPASSAKIEPWEADPEDPLDLADLLATRWSLEVDPPGVRNRTWTITLQTTA